MPSAFTWGAQYPGLQKYAPKARAVDVSTPAGVASVACGYRHTLLATSDGVVYSFGDGSKGQLGRSGVRASPVAVVLPGEDTHTVAAGGFHSVAACASGQLYEWGLCFSDTTSDRVMNENAEGHMRLVGMDAHEGRSEYMRRLIARSEAAYLANRDIAEVEYEAEGDGAGADRAVSGVAPSGVLSAQELLRMRVSRLRVWLPRPVESLRGVRIVSIAAGYAHTLAVASTGEIYAAGYNDRGALGLGHRISQSSFVRIDAPTVRGHAFKTVACGQQHSLAVSSSGHAFSWGSGTLGQLGHGGGDDALSPKLILALRMPLVFTPRGASLAPLDILWMGKPMVPTFDDGDYHSADADGGGDGGNSRVISCAAGSNHSLVLTASGAVLGFGHSEYNQLGSQEAGADLMRPAAHFYLPRLLEGLQRRTAVVGIAAGGQFSLCRLADGSLLSFGFDAYGCLGRDGLESSDGSAFGRVAGLQGRVCTAMACGYNHAVAATAPDGYPFAAPWGRLLLGLNAADPVVLGPTDEGLRVAYRDERLPAPPSDQDAGDGSGAEYSLPLPAAYHALAGSDDSEEAPTQPDCWLSGGGISDFGAVAPAASRTTTVDSAVLSGANHTSTSFGGTKPAVGGLEAVRAEIHASIVAMAKRRLQREADGGGNVAPGPEMNATVGPLVFSQGETRAAPVSESPVACHSIVALARCAVLRDTMRNAALHARASSTGSAAETVPGGDACGTITVSCKLVGSATHYMITMPGVRRAVLYALVAFLYSDSLPPRLPSHRLPQLAAVADALRIPRLSHLVQLLRHAHDRESTVPGLYRHGARTPASFEEQAGSEGSASLPHGAPPDTTFASDWDAVLQSEEGADVRIVLVPPVLTSEDAVDSCPPPTPEQCSFALHSLVLTRYPFFRRLIKGGFSEAREAQALADLEAAGGASSAPGQRHLPVFTVRDVAPSAFTDVVRYMYTGATGHAAAEPSRLLESLALASRLVVPDLALALQDAVGAMMAPEDARELREFAATHGLPRLLAVCTAIAPIGDAPASAPSQ